MVCTKQRQHTSTTQHHLMEARWHSNQNSKLSGFSWRSTQTIGLLAVRLWLKHNGAVVLVEHSIGQGTLDYCCKFIARPQR